MYKFLIFIFLVNLLIRILIIDIIGKEDILPFIISRLLLTAIIVYIWYFKKKKQFDYEVISNRKWLTISLFLLMGSFLLLQYKFEVPNTYAFRLFFIECVSVGILEELLFRKITFEHFYKKTQDYNSSILVTSFLFAIFHLSNLLLGASFFSAIIQIEFAFILGLLLQFIFIRTKSLVFVITLHALINLFGSFGSQISSHPVEPFLISYFINNQLFIAIIYLLIPLYFKGLKWNNLK